MKKVKNTIPVYDICSINGDVHGNKDIIAEPFAAYLEVHPNLRTAHRHSFYHIVLFTKGKGTHTIDFEQFDVVPGQIYFMSPGQVHSWSFKGEVDGYIINFSEELFHNFLSNDHYVEQFTFFRSVAAESIFRLDKKAFAEAVRIISNIVVEVHDSGPMAMDLVRANLVELFIIVHRNVAAAVTHAVPPLNQLILYNFRKRVDEYYAEKRLPKEYAALLYITPNHLNALCRDVLGKSAGEVIRERILLEAKRLLVNAEISMSEIAMKLSFTDSSHFTKFFKKYTSQTPEEFRKAATADN
jgi:AraC family transcriptional activator of pobA